jgi:ABC-type transport system substrate-binding protein
MTTSDRPVSSAARRTTLKALAATSAAAPLAALAPLAASPTAAAAAARLGQPQAAAAQARARKVLRYAFPVAETGFDPAQISDLYSRTITAHIFDGLYTYDHLARPFRIKPNTAAALPQVSDDWRTWTIRLRPGIHFQDDPAFKGRPRELVAADYVYSLKRFFDPRWKSPVYASLAELRIVGLGELREAALKNRTPFPYDVEVDGLRALDRHVLQIRLRDPDPRLLQTLAGGDLFGAVAREVVEAYGERIVEKPVGTGPFRLADWRRSSRIVLERNPGYREHFYDAEPGDDDAEGQAIRERLRGRRLPLIDRVEISIVEEMQPRWLAFLNRQHDWLERLPNEFVNIAIPNGRIAPNLARDGIVARRVLASDITSTIFNIEHPVIGGYTPERVALRRAISLATHVEQEIRLLRRGQAVPAQSAIMPGLTGYDPSFVSEMSEYSPARARALLDLFGYLDRDGDGWREMPDGGRLVLEFATQPDQVSRQQDELRRKDMAAVGLRVEFRPAKWPENLKSARAGNFMLWSVGNSAAAPDGQQGLARGASAHIGGQNLARFRNARFDEIFTHMGTLPDGPERLALFTEAKKILIAWAPYKHHVHRILTDMFHPWMTGYRRPPYWQQFWQYIDIDAQKQAEATA